MPGAEIIDVGRWDHAQQQPLPADGISVKGLRALIDDPLVGPFAEAILERDYPVEQEASTLTIVDALLAERPDVITS